MSDIDKLPGLLAQIKKRRYLPLPRELDLFFSILISCKAEFTNLEDFATRYPKLLDDVLMVYLLVGDTIKKYVSRADVEQLIVLRNQIQDYFKNKLAEKESDFAVQCGAVTEIGAPIPEESTPSSNVPVWQQWKLGDTPRIREESSQEGIITYRVYLNKVSHKVFGVSSGGHAALQIGNDTYISFVATLPSFLTPDTPSHVTAINTAAAAMHVPGFKIFRGVFVTKDMDESQIGSRYSGYVEVQLDCSKNQWLDIQEIQAKAQAMLYSPARNYEFWRYNCGHVCLDVLSVGNQQKEWQPPSLVTPLKLYESLLTLARKINFAKTHCVDEEAVGWKELFYHFSVSLVAIDHIYAEHHFDLEQYELNLPAEKEAWFPFEPNQQPYEDYAEFIKHLQLIALALSRRETPITEQEIIFFIEKVQEFIITYDNQETKSLAVLIALEPIATKFSRDRTGLIGKAFAKEAQTAVYRLFKSLVNPRLFTPKVVSPDPVADLEEAVAGRLEASSSPHDLDTFSSLSSNSDLMTAKEGVKDGPQSFTFTPEAQVAAFFIANYLNDYYEAEDKALYEKARFAWSEIVEKNSYLTHLDRLLSTTVMGLGLTPDSPAPFSFAHMVLLRDAIYNIYYLQDSFKKRGDGGVPEGLPIIPDHFYTDIRNNLRKLLQAAVETTYFSDDMLRNSFRACFGLDAVYHKRVTMDMEIEEAIRTLHPTPIPDPRPIPKWKFWQRAKKNSQHAKYNSACITIINCLENKELTPYHKAPLIAKILQEQTPSRFAFWNKKWRIQYQQLGEKVELLLMMESFLKGYASEESFCTDLYAHAEYCNNLSTARDFADKFKVKYTEHITEVYNTIEEAGKHEARADEPAIAEGVKSSALDGTVAAEGISRSETEGVRGTGMSCDASGRTERDREASGEVTTEHAKGEAARALLKKLTRSEEEANQKLRRLATPTAGSAVEEEGDYTTVLPSKSKYHAILKATQALAVDSHLRASAPTPQARAAEFVMNKMNARPLYGPPRLRIF